MSVARHPWRGVRRLAAAVPLLLPIASGCAIEQVLPAPDCAEGGTVVLVAQSVPSASLVPCFDALPEGWAVDTVRIGQDGTVIHFDSDRAGVDAAVFHYTAGCDVGEAVDAPSEYEHSERFDLVERIDDGFRAQRYYVFDGGCMWWEFDFDRGATAALSIELGDRVHTTGRDELTASIRDSFLDVDV